MTTIVSTTELRNMQEKDLWGEIVTQKSLVAKMKIGIELQKEKDTAKYRREKKTLSRMMTVLSEKNQKSQQSQKEHSSAPSKSSVSSDSSKPKGLRGKAKSSKISAP